MISPECFTDRAVQVNDGLLETAACASSLAYDSANGLIFLSYLTGLQKAYGESSGKLCLSVFPPGQPTNIRHVVLDTGIGLSRGLLCNCIYLIGDACVRVVFTVDRGERLAAFCRDYDLHTDTVSERKEILFRTAKGDVPLNNEGYRQYLAEKGLECPSAAAPYINKASRFQGSVYTAVTLDGVSYPVLCRFDGYTLVPFAVCPHRVIYEFRYYRDEAGYHAVYRVPQDDTGTGRVGWMESADGAVWEGGIFPDAIQSRPDILPYEGKPLRIYNYLSGQSTGNFPPMHHHRNAIKMVRDGKTVLDVFSPYGIVEHETLSLFGDLYIAYSDTAQALMMVNHAAWREDGHEVENGKERINFAKIGYPGAR